MSKTGEFKVSRLNLLIIAILLFLAVAVAVAFMVLSSDDENKQSANTDRYVKENSLEQKHALKQPINSAAEFEQFDKLTFPRPNTNSTINIFPSNLESSAKESSAEESSTTTNSFAQLDDESLLNISDVLENSLVPVFLNGQNSDEGFDQIAAVDVFVSRLPEGLSSDDFQKVNALLRDYLPYDLADSIALKAEEKYRLNEQEQAYLSSVLVNEAPAKTMDEQIVIAKHLDSLKGSELQQEPQGNAEPSRAYSDWKKTEEKLVKIQSSSKNFEQDIHHVITEEYESQVADDYIELSNIENQWQEKYAVFLEEKNIITASGLSEEDKTEQIENLIQQHYDAGEWAAVRGYDQVLSQQVNDE